MKAKVKLDKRPEIDKTYDNMWTKMIKDARLNKLQEQIVARYLRTVLQARIAEIESVVDMGWVLALIEVEGFGTDVNKGATRLPRVQAKSCEIRNEAFSHDCFNANGHYESYDGCAVEHLKRELRRYGIEYEVKV